MFANRWILCSLFVAAVCVLDGHTVDAEMTVKPVNTVALAGTTVVLQCTGIGIVWHRYTDSNSDTIVSDPCRLRPGFSEYSVVNTSTGQCDLVISNVSLQLAARYRCEDVHALIDSANADLTVIESCPTGTQSSSVASIGDTVTLTCYINYRPALMTRWNVRPIIPLLYWCPGTDEPATRCSNNTKVCSSLTVNITSTSVHSQSCYVSYPSAVVAQPLCNAWKPKITVTFTGEHTTAMPLQSNTASGNATTTTATCTCQDVITAIIALGVVCAVLLIGLIAAIVYIIWNKRKSQAKDNSQPLSDINRQETSTTTRPTSAGVTYETLDMDTEKSDVKYEQPSPRYTTPNTYDQRPKVYNRQSTPSAAYETPVNYERVPSTPQSTTPIQHDYNYNPEADLNPYKNSP